MQPTHKELWDQAWDLLSSGQSEADHPYRTAVVSTVSGNNATDNISSLHPRARLIVLRECSQKKGELWGYTDRRSQKAHDLTTGTSAMSWTFWAPDQRIQFTAYGPTNWLDQAKAMARFRALPKHARKAYATIQPPGTFQNTPGSGLPEDWEQRSLAETDYASVNFGVLVTELRYAEVLLLSRERHLRLQASKSKKEERWALRWLVP